MSKKDFLIRAITTKGAFRALAVSVKNIVTEAREKHNLSNTATVALGRAVACGVLLCYTLRKTKGQLLLKISGNGPLKEILVDVNTLGQVRAYVNEPSVECFDENNYVSISKAVGSEGFVEVFYEKEEGIPYKSSVELVSGEIGTDVLNYLVKSEQINSSISCGVYLNPETNEVEHAGGILIQTMPEATDEDIKKVEDSVGRLDPFTMLLRRGLTYDHIILKSLSAYQVDFVPQFEGLHFHCDCGKEKFESAVKLLGKDEIQKIIDEVGFAEGKCHFCSSTYKIEKEELKKFLS